MKMKQYWLSIYCLFCTTPLLFAQINKPQLPAPSGRVYQLLEATDTLTVQFDQNEDMYLTHSIKKGQTMYALQKFYQLSPEILHYHNPHIHHAGLAIGTEIIIPITERSLLKVKEPALNHLVNTPVFYQIRAGDTMYKLTQQIFKITPQLLRIHNPHLQGDLLPIGENILVGWVSVYGLEEKEQHTGPHAAALHANDQLKEKYLTESLQKIEYSDDGAAYCIIKDLNQPTRANLYCSYNKAPVNSIVKIHDMMSGQTIFARVKAHIPAGRYHQEVKIVLSEDIARTIGAIDTRRHVKIYYLK